jgi:hypothetical protein
VPKRGKPRLLPWELAAQPAVEATGLLFPRGDLGCENPPPRHRRPVRTDRVIAWWHKAERIVGVPSIKGRAFHAIRRVAVTIAGEDIGSLSPAAQQSGTDEKTLRDI